MDTQQVFVFVDTMVFEKTGKHLTNVQRVLLSSSLSDRQLRYHDIAKSYGYSVSYLKQDIGPKLWRLLSEVFGEKVSKNNFRSALERKWYQVDKSVNVETFYRTSLQGF